MFDYRNGVLHADDIALPAIAAAHGTPSWVYSQTMLEQRYRRIEAALAGTGTLICYALKANSSQAVIATLARLGAGADIVSGGELARALAAGVPAGKIVFAGVGKTEAEMAAALEAGVLQFNVESESELRALSRVAQQAGKTAPVALRVNPHVDANTHAKITTGTAENKFGIEFPQAPAVAQLARTLPNLSLECIAVHIGSQLTSIDPYRAAFARVAELARALLGDGHRLKRIDCGGGLGLAYQPDAQAPDLAAYAAAVREHLAPLGLALIVEPGRWLAGPCGVLLTRVIYLKQGTTRRFVIVDAAMSELIRPTLYEAYHEILPVLTRAGAEPQRVDVVGPICESGDYLARERMLAAPREGDLLAIMNAGAYAAVMSSTYNARPLAPEIMVRGRDLAVVRKRETIAELIARESLPAWPA
jgi:diaminopimelate decarboxylase